jgi:hypothetical protein
MEAVRRKMARVQVTQQQIRAKKKTVERFRTSARWNYADIFTTGRKLMDTGDIPDDWKTANVTPIFKCDLGNYRPVSLT